MTHALETLLEPTTPAEVCRSCENAPAVVVVAVADQESGPMALCGRCARRFSDQMAALEVAVNVRGES